MIRRLDDQQSGDSNVLVVFVGHTECRHLRWLKQGFRHCFVALRSGGRWIICDSLKDRLECMLVDLPSDFDLPQFYQQRGHTVLVGQSSLQMATGSTLPEPLTCVTVAKRIIGIRSFWTFTPWQLFCLLTSMSEHWRIVE